MKKLPTILAALAAFSLPFSAIGGPSLKPSSSARLYATEVIGKLVEDKFDFKETTLRKLCISNRHAA